MSDFEPQPLILDLPDFHRCVSQFPTPSSPLLLEFGRHELDMLPIHTSYPDYIRVNV